MLSRIAMRYRQVVRFLKRKTKIKHGIKKSPKWFFEVMATALDECAFDKKYKVDTALSTELSLLKIDSQNKQRGRDYAPTRVRPFKKLMNKLAFPEQSVFVDFGCGKGRVLLLASFYNFKRIVGIDFSRELCGIAENNINIFKRNNFSQADIEVIHSDCVEYNIRSDDNVFFFFHPFDDIIMTKIVTNIYESLPKYRRKVWLIYNNPKFCVVIDQFNGIFHKEMEYSYDGCQFFVYTNTYPEF